MKIIIAAGIYPPDIGGPATYSQLIAKEFIRQGIQVSLICYSDAVEAEKRGYQRGKTPKFKVVRILRKNKLVRYFRYFWNLLRLAKNSNVIYAQGPLSAGLPAMWTSKILHKKFVIKIVGDYAWEQHQNKESRIKNQEYEFIDIETFQNGKYDFFTELRRKIQKRVVKSANKVIVPSEFLKKIVKGWGIDEKNIKVIYNAVLMQQRNKETKNIKGIKDNTIISAGRLEPWKGMDTLVEIMPELLNKNSNYELTIVGRGPERDNLKLKIKNLKLEKKAKLIDRLPHQELMKYFKASKIFVLNTGYEGLPHIILEAMACGLPVITTNVCGNPEVIKDGYNGLLVEYNNKEQLKKAILKLWRDEKLQKKIIENGHKTLEKFKLEKMINKTLEILKL